ncbi:MAG: altronate dehydratase family protein [Defluviitaleaceae bacterium]|nr:altronate dehydratase family protein [Defluviitaleaceae bacterium]
MLKSNGAIKINPNDNVAVAFEEIPEGTLIFDIPVADTIPAGHKIALSTINPKEHVVKYGYPIGSATKLINPGDHVHTHNLKTNLDGIDNYDYNPVEVLQRDKQQRTFMGYKRPNGKAGIRNEIWIINTVGCVNKIAEKIAQEANFKFKEHIENKCIDGVFTFVHPYGCSQLGDDHTYTQNVLKGLVDHPNAAGVLVLGLGCENNHIDEFKTVLKSWDDNRVKFLNAQDVKDDIEAGLHLVDELVKYAKTFKREPISTGELVIGLKCGGSDGLSGITANALVGNLSDSIIDNGGSCLLTEVPEMFGAETLLMNRCINEDVFKKSVSLINDFKDYFIRHKQAIYENPSPGNKEGGISTLEDKSLGCTQKGGISPVIDVLNYGETVKCPGLNLLQGPGNDIVAVTNLAVSGAHLVLFTTGRGTPLGGPVPTVKISSNTALAKNKPHWIDFDAGVLVQDADPKEVNLHFFDYIVKVAEGEETQNELNGYREIAIFKDGVTL